MGPGSGFPVSGGGVISDLGGWVALQWSLGNYVPANIAHRGCAEPCPARYGVVKERCAAGPRPLPVGGRGPPALGRDLHCIQQKEIVKAQGILLSVGRALTGRLDVNATNTRWRLAHDPELQRSPRGGGGSRRRRTGGTPLEPLGGPDDKVFPPTYSVAKNAETAYALERRRVAGETVEAAVLDSVQSQANHFEAALLEAHRCGEMKIPLVTVDFREADGVEGLDRISSLEAPHRIFDAILRDSLLDDMRFPLTDIGASLTEASSRNAAALFRYAPHTPSSADGTPPGRAAGGRQVRARAHVGDRGHKGGARQEDIVADRPACDREARGSRIPGRRRRMDTGPERGVDREGRAEAARRQWRGRARSALSDQSRQHRPQHRRARRRRHRRSDPCDHGALIRATPAPALSAHHVLHACARCSPAVVDAGHATLAALGLAATVLAFEEGFDLRSRCVLYASEDLSFQPTYRGSKASRPFTLDRAGALALLERRC